MGNMTKPTVIHHTMLLRSCTSSTRYSLLVPSFMSPWSRRGLGVTSSVNMMNIANMQMKRVEVTQNAAFLSNIAEPRRNRLFRYY